MLLCNSWLCLLYSTHENTKSQIFSVPSKLIFFVHAEIPLHYHWLYSVFSHMSWWGPYGPAYNWWAFQPVAFWKEWQCCMRAIKKFYLLGAQTLQKWHDDFLLSFCSTWCQWQIFLTLVMHCVDFIWGEARQHPNKSWVLSTESTN